MDIQDQAEGPGVAVGHWTFLGEKQIVCGGFGSGSPPRGALFRPQGWVGVER